MCDMRRRLLQGGAGSLLSHLSTHAVCASLPTPTAVSGAALGFEQDFTVAFSSAGDRNYYVGQPIVMDPAHFDPHHEKFKAFVGPLLAPQDGVLVFDYAVDAP